MKPEARRFARVYYDDMVRDHPDVWRDNELLSTWLRMLVACEKSWPSLAEIPRSARPRAVARLVEFGMVTVTDQHHFGLRGFTSDRAARQDTARTAAAKRWHSESNADAMLIRERERERGKGEQGRRPLAPGGRASDGLVGPDKDAA